MKKTLVLVGGYPGAGKSYVTRLLMDVIQELQSINLDEIEERQFDALGFNNQKEKTEIIDRCRLMYFDQIKAAMGKGELIISDYPFSYKQRPYFEKYAKKYGYQIVTIRLVGDLETIYQRRIQRDLKQSRHLGHIVQTYHKGDVLIDRRNAESLITKEDFMKKIKESEYGLFSMGLLIELDVTDFSNVDYEGMVQTVVSYINEVS